MLYNSCNIRFPILFCYSSAESFYTIGNGDGQIWLDDMDCEGHEYSLTDCTHTLWADHNCDHGEDIGVYCVKGTNARLLLKCNLK